MIEFEQLIAGNTPETSDTGAEVARKINENFGKVPTKTSDLTNDSGFIAPDESGNIDADSGKIVNVASPTANTDAATKGYVDAKVHNKISNGIDGPGIAEIDTNASGIVSINGYSGVSISTRDNIGLDMNHGGIKNVYDPQDAQDAATKAYVDMMVRPASSWAGIQSIIRAGRGADFFPVGYELTTLDSSTGNDIVWAVRDHDHHAAAGSSLSHTMTIEVKYLYGQRLQFDAPEAIYYAAEGLAAGTYNFTWDYTTGSVAAGTYQFTLTQAVPARGQIVLGTNSASTPIISCKISTHASVGATSAIESNIAVTAGYGGTSLGTISENASTNPNLNCGQRILLGSNNYAQSAVRQSLNSAAAAGLVWTPTNKFDRAPSWAASQNGFMYGLPADFLSVVQPAVVPCLTNSVFEIESLDGTVFTTDQLYNLSDKFFLLSYFEIMGGSASLQDGTQLEYYKGLTAAERIKRTEDGTAGNWWLRSSYPFSASVERFINADGNLDNQYAISPFGATPACIIA